LYGILKNNESPIKPMPANQNSGVYAGASKPNTLLLQAVVGKYIKTTHAAKYNKTPATYSSNPHFFLSLIIFSGIKEIKTNITNLEIFSP